MGISRQTNLNVGMPSVADLGGQRVLNMSGSLTNWINTGNAGTLDTFQRRNRTTFEDNNKKRKNQIIKKVAIFGAGLAASIVGLGVAVKHLAKGKSVNIDSDDLGGKNLLNRLKEFFNSPKTKKPKAAVSSAASDAVSDATSEVVPNVTRKGKNIVSKLNKKANFKTIKFEVVNGKLQLEQIEGVEVDPKELDKVLGTIQSLSIAKCDTDDLVKQIEKLSTKMRQAAVDTVNKFFEPDAFATIKLERIDGEIKISPKSEKIDEQELKSLKDAVFKLGDNEQEKGAFESALHKLEQLQEYDSETLAIIDELPGYMNGLFKEAFVIEIDKEAKRISFKDNQGKMDESIPFNISEVQKRILTLKRLEEAGYEVDMPERLQTVLSYCRGDLDTSDMSVIPDTSQFEPGPLKGTISRDRGPNLEEFEDSGEVVADIPQVDTGLDDSSVDAIVSLTPNFIDEKKLVTNPKEFKTIKLTFSNGKFELTPVAGKKVDLNELEKLKGKIPAIKQKYELSDVSGLEQMIASMKESLSPQTDIGTIFDIFEL